MKYHLVTALSVALCIATATVLVLAPARPTPFRLAIGDCMWTPPSAEAAVAATMYFFGVGAETDATFVTDFHLILMGQYRAAGKSTADAAREIARFDRCVDSYVPRVERP